MKKLLKLIGIGNKPTITYVIQEYAFGEPENALVAGAILSIKGDSAFREEFNSTNEAVEGGTGYIKKYHIDKYVVLEFRPTEYIELAAKINTDNIL